MVDSKNFHKGTNKEPESKIEVGRSNADPIHLDIWESLRKDSAPLQGDPTKINGPEKVMNEWDFRWNNEKHRERVGGNDTWYPVSKKQFKELGLSLARNPAMSSITPEGGDTRVNMMDNYLCMRPKYVSERFRQVRKEKMSKREEEAQASVRNLEKVMDKKQFREFMDFMEKGRR